MSVMSRTKKDCLSFTVSFKEIFNYIKAIFVGRTKKMTARNEKEAAAAELQAEKMQVEPANEAENVKNKIDKSIFSILLALCIAQRFFWYHIADGVY
ncbi:hypothetical protein DKX38_002596 [Salix brachista]|uniref:Uncharacterized protein n=1 Tax=Salix brachista TaxID=2182728 RepID=A0A5N5NPZ4_9ROSI|nr:hypothetical protein DKX38_002596 [Salix brachista]